MKVANLFLSPGARIVRDRQKGEVRLESEGFALRLTDQSHLVVSMRFWRWCELVELGLHAYSEFCEDVRFQLSRLSSEEMLIYCLPYGFEGFEFYHRWRRWKASECLGREKDGKGS